jgi:hypothetical protein
MLSITCKFILCKSYFLFIILYKYAEAHDIFDNKLIYLFNIIHNFEYEES